jgi:hypothetical protein
MLNVETNSSNLETDISHIDFRLNTINKNIVLLQSNVDRLTQIIMSSSVDKMSLYNAQAESLRTLALYNDNYQRLLDLKFKYRTEQDDLSLKSFKLNADSSGTSHNELIQALSKLGNINSFSSIKYEKDESI